MRRSCHHLVDENQPVQGRRGRAALWRHRCWCHLREHAAWPARLCTSDLHPQVAPTCMLHPEAIELQGLGAFMVALLVVKPWKLPRVHGRENRVKSGPSTQRRVSGRGNRRPPARTSPQTQLRNNTHGNKASHGTRYTPPNTHVDKIQKRARQTVGLRHAIRTLKPQRKARD